MTDKQKITEILKAYTKKHNISASTVILEEYAEELVANGVIVPPCKVGDTVYRPSKYLGYVVPFVIISFEATQSEMFYTDDSDNIIYIGDIGKTVFLTKEEAEAELRKRSEYNA